MTMLPHEGVGGSLAFRLLGALARHGSTLGRKASEHKPPRRGPLSLGVYLLARCLEAADSRG